MRQASTEVLIVGGGPAGLAAAIALRLRGADVLVVDRAWPPLDKACGEGLMPDGLSCLEELGVHLDAIEGMPFRGIRYLDGDVVAEAQFPDRPGRGVRRKRLHTLFVRRAEEVGARLIWGSPVTRLRPDGVETRDGIIQARWVLAADGLHSPVRRLAGLDRGRAGGRFGVRRHYAASPWTDLVEVYWVDGVEAYVTPVAPQEVGVALLFDRRHAAPFDRLLESFPALRRRLAGAEIGSKDRGAGPLQRRVRAVARGSLALIGDASGYVDALTGEGLSVAFRHAQALAEALAAGDLRLYARAHRRLVALPSRLTHLLLFVERRPWLRRRFIRALAADPDLFAAFLALLARSHPVERAGIRNAARLVLRLGRTV